MECAISKQAEKGREREKQIVKILLDKDKCYD